MPTQTISAEEYQAFLEERERVKKAMDAAESEFMFQTYRSMLRVLNKRYEAATKLNIKMENRTINEQAKQKRQELQAEKAS